MNKVRFYLPVLAILLFSLAAQAQTVNFRGNIGEARFQMTLVHSGNELSGTYFYEKQGGANKLNLKGSIDAEGNFTLRETDSAGKQTGTFKGKWSEGEMSAGVWLEGTWKNPAGKELTFSASQQNIYFTGNLSFVSRKISENNKLKMFEVSAEYPELTGAAANPNIAKFNALAKQTVSKSVAHFKKDMQELTAEDLKFARERGISNFIEIGYNVEYADNDLVSLMFDESTFTGGAHPNHFSYTINYDLRNGRELALADLFKPNSNYLKVISDNAIPKLKTELGEMSDEEWIKTGAGADAGNFKSWNFSQKGLVLNFDPYQVAAYAAGPQYVVIPYENLLGILKPNSVVSNLKK